MGKLLLSVAALALICGTASATTLTNGSGDGALTVTVTDYGTFGSATAGADAFYNPLGSVASAGTTFQSSIYAPISGRRDTLDEIFTRAATIVSETATELVTNFGWGQLDITLTQTLDESFDGGDRVGSLLTQSFEIVNTGSVTSSFNLVRYIDGDLDFDGSISDSGGILSTGSTRTLFETDSSSSSGDSTTFLGVTNTVQGPNMTSASQNYEISSFSGLRSKIQSGGSLGNFVNLGNGTTGSGNNTFIQQPYDVTMALEDFLSIGGGQGVTYTTSTLFGNAVPAAPGSNEAAPLLPDSIGPAGGFNFEIAESDIPDSGIIWIDPVIATGYTYEVTGAAFSQVQAPSFGTVPDGDMMYTLTFGGSSVQLISGELFSFVDNGGPVSSFTITGIDPALALDPTDTAAFVTGIGLTDFIDGVAIVTQTPITEDIPDTAPVPLPAAAWLMLAGLGGLVTAGRKWQTAV